MQMFQKSTMLFLLLLPFVACKKDYGKKMTGTYRGSTKYYLRNSYGAITDTVLSESKITIEKTSSLNTVKITISNPGLNDLTYKEVSVSGDNLKYYSALRGTYTTEEIKGSLSNQNELSLFVGYTTTEKYAWNMQIQAVK
jgi:hypothetical protein